MPDGNTFEVDGSFGITRTGTVQMESFRWRKDSDPYTTRVSITTTAQLLQEGFSVTFAGHLGHVLADTWDITVDNATGVITLYGKLL